MLIDVGPVPPPPLLLPPPIKLLRKPRFDCWTGNVVFERFAEPSRSSLGSERPWRVLPSETLSTS